MSNKSIQWHIKMYLSYFNDFITVSAFANYYALDYDNAQDIINIGRQLNNEVTQC